MLAPDDIHPVGVTVNGKPITATAIALEMQHHPATAAHEAWNEAACALVVRELLVQEARRRRVRASSTDADGQRRETPEEAMVSALLAEVIGPSTPDEDACRSYFDAHRAQFRSPDLVEAEHILFAAKLEDAASYGVAVGRAERAIAAITDGIVRLDEIARRESDCPSSAHGGRLGQLAPGDMVPEFDTFLFSLEEGQLCPIPVKTRFGAHVLRVLHRKAGRDLPFEAVRERIVAYLTEADWRRRVAAFIAELASRARIEGVEVSDMLSPDRASMTTASGNEGPSSCLCRPQDEACRYR